jgi:hypothetical protein
LARVDRSDFRLPVFVIYTSKVEVLRRPVESALDPSVAMMDEAVTAGVSGMSRTMLKFGRVALLD